MPHIKKIFNFYLLLVLLLTTGVVYASISWPTNPDGETAGWSIGAIMSIINIDNGSVGIGTPSTIARLEVSESSQSTKTAIAAGRIESSSALWTYWARIVGLNTSNDANAHWWIFWSKHVDSYALLVWRHDTAYNSFVVKGSGNVGIGTTDPLRKLHVYGASDTLWQWTIMFGSNEWVLRVGSTWDDYDFNLDGMNANVWYNRLHIDRVSGNVGIGTTSPWVDLDVSDSDTAYIRALISWQTNNPTIYMSADEANNVWWLYSTAPKLQLWASNSIHITINDSGNVGIGTTSPATKLHIQWLWDIYSDLIWTDSAYFRVSSDANAGIQFKKSWTSQWTIYNNSGSISNPSDNSFNIASHNPWDWTPELTMSSDGNVGIGITNPLTKLDINGGLRLWSETTCTATNYGSLRFQDNALSICSWSRWKTITTAFANDQQIELDTSDSDNPRQWTDGTYAKSCLEYIISPDSNHIYTWETGNWIYWIDPDGASGGAYSPFKVYCDMTTDWWWWTLVWRWIWWAANNWHTTWDLNLAHAVTLQQTFKFADATINDLVTTHYRFEWDGTIAQDWYWSWGCTYAHTTPVQTDWLCNTSHPTYDLTSWWAYWDYHTSHLWLWDWDWNTWILRGGLHSSHNSAYYYIRSSLTGSTPACNGTASNCNVKLWVK